jgi:hypothetical protein
MTCRVCKYRRLKYRILDIVFDLGIICGVFCVCFLDNETYEQIRYLLLAQMLFAWIAIDGVESEPCEL